MEKFKNSLQFHILVTYRRYTYIVEKRQFWDISDSQGNDNRCLHCVVQIFP